MDPVAAKAQRKKRNKDPRPLGPPFSEKTGCCVPQNTTFQDTKGQSMTIKQTAKQITQAIGLGDPVEKGTILHIMCRMKPEKQEDLERVFKTLPAMVQPSTKQRISRKLIRKLYHD